MFTDKKRNILCCCRLNSRPRGGRFVFRLWARLAMFFKVTAIKWSRSSVVIWSVTYVLKPSKTVSIRLSSSGSKLTLNGIAFYHVYRNEIDWNLYSYLQRSWIFCMISNIGSSSVHSCNACRRLWMLDHHGRSQGSITRAILDIQNDYLL